MKKMCLEEAMELFFNLHYNKYYQHRIDMDKLLKGKPVNCKESKER